MSTPVSIPAVNRSLTRKLKPYYVSEAYLYLLPYVVLHCHPRFLRSLTEFQQTFPFPDGEPTVDEYRRAWQAWHKHGEEQRVW